MKTNPNYLLFIVFLLSVINFLDRQVLSILQEDIKVDLSLNDSQLGMLALGFGVFYAVFALPIGRMADRFQRKTIILACLSLWSVVTSATALVQGFGTLLAARMGVAIGEAGAGPISHSMIADKFPVERRATAIAIYGAGVPVGLMLSILLGGLIAEAFGWRMTFLFFGIPGLLLAILFFLTVSEPERGSADGLSEVTEAPPLKQAVTQILSSKGFVLIVAGATAQAMVGYSMLHWLPSYFIRTYGLSVSDVAVKLGPIIGGTGLVGVLVTAAVADYLGKKDRRWYAWVLALSMVVAFPFYCAAILVKDFNLSLVLIAVPLFTGTAFLGISNALVQSLVPVRTRALSSAMKTICLNIFGFGLGGQLVGLLSDAYASDVSGEGLGFGLITVGLFNLVAMIFYLFSAKYLDADIERAVTLSKSR